MKWNETKWIRRDGGRKQVNTYTHTKHTYTQQWKSDETNEIGRDEKKIRSDGEEKWESEKDWNRKLWKMIIQWQCRRQCGTYLKSKTTTATATTADFWDPSSSKHQYYTNYLKNKQLVGINGGKETGTKKKINCMLILWTEWFYVTAWQHTYTHGKFWRT